MPSIDEGGPDMAPLPSNARKRRGQAVTLLDHATRS